MGAIFDFRSELFMFFYLQVTPILSTKFQVNWPFGSGQEAKNRFSRWWPLRPSWISDWNDFSYFWFTNHPDDSYQVWSQLAFQFRRRSENRFSRWPPFPIGTILAIVDLKVTLMLPYQVSSISPQEKKWTIGVQDGRHCGHLGFPIGTILAIFDLRHPDAFYQVSSQLAFRFRRRSEK